MKSSVLAQIEWSSILAAFSAQFRTCNFGQNSMTGDSLVLEIIGNFKSGLDFQEKTLVPAGP